MGVPELPDHLPDRFDGRDYPPGIQGHRPGHWQKFLQALMTALIAGALTLLVMSLTAWAVVAIWRQIR